MKKLLIVDLKEGHLYRVISEENRFGTWPTFKNLTASSRFNYPEGRDVRVGDIIAVTDLQLRFKFSIANTIELYDCVKCLSPSGLMWLLLKSSNKNFHLGFKEF